MTDPFARQACSQPTVNMDWWGIDATPAEQTTAATLCMGCPAIQACDQYRLSLGTDAAGTYAAVYQPLVDVETDTEFLEIAAALGWDDTTPDRLGMRDTDPDQWEQLTLWGPSVTAATAAVASRRRGVRPGRGSAGGRRAAVPVDAQGA